MDPISEQVLIAINIAINESTEQSDKIFYLDLIAKLLYKNKRSLKTVANKTQEIYNNVSEE